MEILVLNQGGLYWRLCLKEDCFWLPLAVRRGEQARWPTGDAIRGCDIVGYGRWKG